MTIYQIGLLQVGFLCFIGLCIYALGKAVAHKRKPEPDWKAKYEEAWAIAGRLYAEMEREYSFEQEARSQAMREYEEAAKHD